MSTPDDNKRQQLSSKLKERFQPDLDFGLYRIMHAKSAEITQFLEKDLLSDHPCSASCRSGPTVVSRLRVLDNVPSFLDNHEKSTGRFGPSA
jgi:hypothetical protein